ncbi:MAG TPA: methyltransferase domain-containing protein [Actinomycetes bacterium]|jgi:SAM-dependent methyltransferase|nr:methyltransferase domain-containing protein [Actinomycetes bacterium]
MSQGGAKPESRSSAALASYEELGTQFDQHDPRDQYTYMSSKFRSDYTLMEHVGVDGKSVLNVGCSFPVDELYYARKVDRWVSVDLSARSLEGAGVILNRELHPDLARKFSFVLADACDLPFEHGTFDLSICMSTVDHIPSAGARQKAVDEMARTTKPGGHVVVTVPNWWCLPYAAGIWKMTREKTLHYGYAHLFSPREIREIGRRAGLKPVFFASSIAPPEVWLPGYPLVIRWPARLTFRLLRFLGYFGRRVGYVFEKPVRSRSSPGASGDGTHSTA